ncbi:MAG: endonuclease/exonuclease/phosphatase family protein [Anaerolineae bacterium]|nr:endonuclease/exonuclease/phosphatase family protein [Anaerolineae bacterium]
MTHQSFIRRAISQLPHTTWKIVQIGLAGYGLFMIVYLLARLLTGEAWAWVLIANNFVPWWALGGAIAAGIALFSRYRLLLVALQLPILIVFVVWYGDLLWPPPSPAVQANTADPDTIDLTVATYNIRASHSDPYRITETITTFDADMIGLQELDSSHAAVIFSALAEVYPYNYHFKMASPSGNEMNVGILSRYAILTEERYTDRTHGRDVRLLVDVEGITISVYLEHPNSPQHAFSPIDYDPTFHDIKISNLADELASDPRPVIVLCDCNMTDQSETYRQLNDLLIDSFREIGWGLGFTFPAHPLFGSPVTVPMLRLDYIWHSDHFIATDIHVGHDSGSSDHFPVIATLRLPKDTVIE